MTSALQSSSDGLVFVSRMETQPQGNPELYIVLEMRAGAELWLYRTGLSPRASPLKYSSSCQVLRACSYFDVIYPKFVVNGVFDFLSPSRVSCSQHEWNTYALLYFKSYSIIC